MKKINLLGPLGGQPQPRHGGAPGAAGCNGCTDCCHLPEISITDEEECRLEARYADLEAPMGELIIRPDPSNAGWKLMQGPCVFRQLDTPLAAGGCRIYDDRPAGCDIFTCSLLLELRRASR